MTATDESPKPNSREAAAKLRAAGVKLELGGHAVESFLEQDLIVVSPGVPAKICAARAGARARNSGVERNRTGLAISAREAGGDHRLERQDDHDFACGAHSEDGGTFRRWWAATSARRCISLVESSIDSTVTVAEISSFQLETIEAFRPEIGVLLNLTPDHLDRHASFEEYAAAKMRMFENQLERDFAVLNADDPEVTQRMPRARTSSGSADRNEWPPEHSCATTKLFSAMKARKTRC